MGPPPGVRLPTLQSSCCSGCAPGYFHLVIAQPAGQAGKSDQLAAFIQQLIRHGYRRHRPTPFASRMAKSRDQWQLGVDDLDVADGAELRSVRRAWHFTLSAETSWVTSMRYQPT